MDRLQRVAVVTLCLVFPAASPAAAEPTQVGAWFGPRLFSSESRLGYIADARAHPVLQNGMTFGGRVARPFLPWLVPELELGISPTSTNAVGGAKSADVFWVEPRLHLRLELWQGHIVQPFVVVGGGSPIALSTANQTFSTSILGEGYVGGGVRFDTTKGFVLRFDARVCVLPAMPGSGFGATAEFDFGFGLEFLIGERRAGGPEDPRLARGKPAANRDGDRLPDSQDGCPDRPEDVDGFEDDDGCPDIDNDLDRVLDIADKCPSTAEAYNGFEDDDGCPDAVPPEVDALRGTIEGLVYSEGETAVRDGATASIRRIARTMSSFPSIRVVLIGHSDDVEAKQFAAIDDGQPAPELDKLSADLSRARAEAVKNALLAAGVPAPRIVVEGRGAEDPVADNTRPRGRLANRRVEIKLYVPVR